MDFGAHMSIAGGFGKALERGVRAGCDVIQIFTKNNNQWKAKDIGPDAAEAFTAAQARNTVRCVAAHTSYLINCASPQKELYERSKEALREEVQRADVLNIPLLVFHPGAHRGSGAGRGIRKIARCVNDVIDANPESGVTLLLETTAGQGSSVGHTFEELAEILSMVRTPSRTAVCLDTCHVFAAGYDFRTAAGYDKMMNDFDKRIGLEYLRLFHLNDSKRECGSRIDRHEHIGRGQIGTSGFRNLLSDSRFFDVPKILETPKGNDLTEDTQNLRVLRRLIPEAGLKRGGQRSCKNATPAAKKFRK